VVSRDATAALLCWARLATSSEGQSDPVRISGLSPDIDYRLRIRGDIGHPAMHQEAAPAWVNDALRDWITVPARY
jgi:alpha-galactosidase